MLKQKTPNHTHMLHPKLFQIIIIIILPFTFGFPVSHLPYSLSYNSLYAFVMSTTDKRFTSFPKSPDRLQGPPNPLFIWYQGLFNRRKDDRGVRLVTHPHLMARLRTNGAIPTFPSLPMHVKCPFYVILYHTTAQFS